ncbi:helix-turn-helix domain-containing protein [Streptosporangium sp. NPDC000563]|uniref:TetR/AcrR family transcriptional regulator n=1 Tax=Streptosporangium sp. NPDC000563 TaxID=3154366 RepID=UPI00331D1805
MRKSGTGRAREAARRAVRAEVASAAERLFLERGYDATTVDAIAEEAGVSPRSVYRYFPTKDDILIERFASIGGELADALRSRPANEPVWDSLAAAFAALTARVGTPRSSEPALLMHRAIVSSPTLFGRYLQQMQLAQSDALDALTDRAVRAARTPQTHSSNDDIALRAIIAAAFGCLVTAQCAWVRTDGTEPFTTTLGNAMAAMRPTREGDRLDVRH